MKISTTLKKRFCKDCNIPINLFQEPYFTERIALYDKVYGTLDKWNIFVEELWGYHSEQDYLEEYNRVKDMAINCIKGTQAYENFNKEDMNQYKVNINLPSRDIFKVENDGKMFISIDMKKANFSTLRHYDKDMFLGAATWEEFIGMFTSNKHIINSKYIRQVIFGNCNPGRHITYEKYLMSLILEGIKKIINNKMEIVSFSNDEIVLDVTSYKYMPPSEATIFNDIYNGLKQYATDSIVPLKIEWFSLWKIQGTNGYYKIGFNQNDKEVIDFKCLDSYMLPFVIRKFLREEVTENDKVFYHDGLLAKFIEVPEIGEI